MVTPSCEEFNWLIWHKYLDLWCLYSIHDILYVYEYGFIHGNVFWWVLGCLGFYYPSFACFCWLSTLQSCRTKMPSCWCHRLQLRVHEAALKHNALRMWLQPDHSPLTMEKGETSPWEKIHGCHQGDVIKWRLGNFIRMNSDDPWNGFHH